MDDRKEQSLMGFCSFFAGCTVKNVMYEIKVMNNI